MTMSLDCLERADTRLSCEIRLTWYGAILETSRLRVGVHDVVPYGS